MKKTLILGLLLQGSIWMYSQIGINTSNPQTVLHVDGAKDNPATGAPSAAQQTNDVVVTANGTIGIGTATPHADAALDITSSNKGFKLPNISLTSTDNPSPLNAHVSGMIVYNTATAGTSPNNVVPGLYVNDGTKWTHVETPSTPGGSGGVPVGTVFYHATNVTPVGYLEANGAQVSRTAYAALFAAIGTTYGIGNGSTTFTLPDLRGEFIRGWDDSRGVDTGRTIGTWQKGSFIAGGAGPRGDGIIPFVTAASGTLMPALTNSLGWDLLTNTVYAANYPSTVMVNNSNDNSATNLNLTAVSDNAGDYAYGVSRPRNVALMPIIKY